MNREVENSGLQMTAAGISFELKSKGNIFLDAAFSAAPEYKNGIQSQYNNESYYYTGENNDNAKWRMELSSGEQLEPGKSGELTFWVVPGKADMSLDMKFSVNMRGFTKDLQIKVK